MSQQAAGRFLYDSIGVGYAQRRRPDPRIAALVTSALGDSGSVANIGAGAGSYEPCDRPVIAVEPSARMLRQRPPDAAPAIQGMAETLPLKDGCVAAAMAILTIHHWADRARGLQELRRVARERVVVLTWDPEGPPFWLTEEYLPSIRVRDLRQFPSMSDLARVLGDIEVRQVPIPHDCTDGFLGAYWRRPHAYLDPAVRSGISAFTDLPEAAAGLARLQQDLESGEWQRRFGHLDGLEALDIGYRLVIAKSGRCGQ